MNALKKETTTTGRLNAFETESGIKKRTLKAPGLKRKASNDINSVNRLKSSKIATTNNRPNQPVTNRNNSTTNTKTKGRPPEPRNIRDKIDYLATEVTDLTTETGVVVNLTKELESQVGTTNTELSQMKDRLYELEAQLKAKQAQLQQALHRLKQQHAQQNRQLEEFNHQYQRTHQEFETNIQAKRSKTKDLHQEAKKGLHENSQLKTKLEVASTKLLEVEAKRDDLVKKLKDTDSTLMEKQKLREELTMLLDSTKKRYHDTESDLLKAEKARRSLHNTLQELKGNIRVFCRMRPSLASERTHDGVLAQVRFDGEQESGGDQMEFSEQVISGTMGNKRVAKTYPFTFDKIFSPQHGQKECFEEISQLVQSALDGYNVCIFAYGQTGSGKTFTMQGPSGADINTMGMIPRAVHQIYDVAQKLSERGWTYTMEGQFLEIYNETIHDLLGDVSEFGKQKHEIRHEKNGKTIVTDVTIVQLTSPSKVKSMLHKANQNRATGATLLNERSSRSHSVFILRLTGQNPTTGEQTSGVLNLIDLAGSERLASSGATGDRLTETKAINKSLSCLGDVIHALAKNKEGSHIPYRNSKLTYLLQNSLGGNCKTLMFVNISPLTEHFGETLCSLRFATKVNSCKVGTARRTK